MAKQQTKENSAGKFEYQRFLDSVNGARQLQAVNDLFAHEVFTYLQTSDCFAAKEFVPLLAELLNFATQPSATDRQMSQDKERFPNYKGDGTEAAQRIAEQFGDAQSFAITAKPKAEKLAKLTFEQKFDLIHFLLCALNFLSNESSFCLPSIEYLTKKRRELILVASREGEHSVPWIRAIEADMRDVEIENQWKTGNLSFMKKNEATSNPDAAVSIPLAGKLTATQQVLAVNYFLKYLRVKDTDKTVIARFLAVLNGGKNYKDIYDKVRDTTLISKNDHADALFIAGLFEQMKQPEIAKLIENDLDQLKSRNL